MPNRFRPNNRKNYGLNPLPTGYPNPGESSGFVIPPVGIEDADAGMFNLFDKEIPFQTSSTDGSDLNKVPIVFAGGEKWAMLKNNRPLRNKVGSLILPIITIIRTGISQSPNEDITGRGINQRTGEIVIKRRLSDSDRNYQNLINRSLLKNQLSVAVSPTEAVPEQISTTREIGKLANDGVISDGGLLVSNRLKNVYETLVIPSPQFYTINYDVVVWTQYTHHMNQIIETLMSSFLPQMQGWRIDTSKGYWFIANMADETFAAETNFEEMGQDERIIKYKFGVKVHAYVLASDTPGAPIPVKRYVSVPDVTFEINGVTDSSSKDTVSEPFLGADDPTLPINEKLAKNVDQRKTNKPRILAPGIDPNDPALESLPRGRQYSKYKKITYKDNDGNLVTKYARVSNINKYTGETVYSSGFDLGSLEIVTTED